MNDIYICIENSCPEVMPELDCSELEDVCKHVLCKESMSSADINIVIVDDIEITALKKEFFNIDQTTDVISFNLSDECSANSCLEAEIVVNAQMAVRQSAESGFSPDAELKLYIIHGLLHQLGYDDQEEKEYIRMHSRENEILDELGVGRVFGTPHWSE